VHVLLLLPLAWLQLHLVLLLLLHLLRCSEALEGRASAA
jgi:hypothetical protein